jgi:hypothetical protein
MKNCKINLSALQREVLERITKQKTSSSRDKERAGIILGLSVGVSSLKLSNDLGLNRHKVQRCRQRWHSHSDHLCAIEAQALSENKRPLLHKAVLSALSDAPRSGSPSKFSAAQYCQILAVSLERPSDSGHAVTHWSLNILKKEVEKRGIVDSISRSHLGAFLKGRRGETS